MASEMSRRIRTNKPNSYRKSFKQNTCALRDRIHQNESGGLVQYVNTPI